MSTTIYKGFRAEMDMLAIHRHTTQLRRMVQENASTQLAKELAGLATFKHDSWLYAEPAEAAGLSPFEAAVLNIGDEQMKPELRRRAFDYSTELSFFPITSSVTLGVIHCGNREIDALIWKEPWLRPYGYWDNTDPDEDVDEVEWAERKRLWNEVYTDELSTSAAAGFTRELCNVRPLLWPSFDQVVAHIPSFEDRARNLGKTLLFQMYQTTREVDLNVGSAVQILSEFGEWQKSSEGKERYTELQQEIINKIPQELTLKMLLEKSPTAS